MRFIVRPAAAADIDETFLWCERQQPGVGHDFLAAVQTLLDATVRQFYETLTDLSAWSRALTNGQQLLRVSARRVGTPRRLALRRCHYNR
jgi:hypothetical protein